MARPGRPAQASRATRTAIACATRCARRRKTRRSVKPAPRKRTSVASRRNSVSLPDETTVRRRLAAVRRLCRRRRGAAQSRLAGRRYRVPAGERPAPAHAARPGHRHRHGAHHLPGRLAPRGLRRERHGAPARAPAVQGLRAPSQHQGRVHAPRRALERHHVERPHDLLRDLRRQRRQSRVGDRDGSRPHAELVRLQATPRQRDERGAQRVRAWREQPRQRAVPAHAAGGLPLAQLRQSDHRHALGHRAGADRQAAGLLPHLVPARQRGADRRRALRRSARPRAGGPALRRPAAAVAAAAGALHRRADPGRRAHGDPAPQRRQPARRADVPRAGRRPPRLCGRRRAHQRARRHAERAAAPRARAEGPGELGLGQRARPARSGLRVLRRGARQVRVPGQGARRADPGHRKPPQGQNYRGGSRSRAHRAAQRLREIAARRRRLRARPFRIFRHGRLAPILPVSRPPAQAQPGRRAARRRALLEAGKPGPRRFRADRAARARRDPGGHWPGGSACRLSRRRYQVARARRGLRPLAGQHRIARPRRRLANGINAALLSKKTRGGRVVASLALHWGDEKSLFNREVACDFAGGMLMRGSKKHTRAQLKDAFDKLNATVSVGGQGASIEVRKENLAAALRLVAEALREPVFPPAEFDEMKRAAITGAEAQRTDPAALAGVRLARHLQLYPKGHPFYTPTIEERIEKLRAARLGDAEACYRDLFGATGADFAAVGEFDPGETARLVEELFGSWRTPLPFERVPARYFDRPAVENAFVTPDKANAVLRAGLNVRMRDDHPDYPAVTLANYLLGGPSTARVPVRVREKEGLSYSTYTTFNSSPFDESAEFRVASIFAPQNRDRVERAIREELERAVRAGFTAGEVEEGRKSLLEARRMARTQDRALVGRLGSYLFAKRTFAWDIEFEAKIAALTADQVNAALRQHIDPARLSVVVAGDFKQP